MRLDPATTDFLPAAPGAVLSVVVVVVASRNRFERSPQIPPSPQIVAVRMTTREVDGRCSGVIVLVVVRSYITQSARGNLVYAKEDKIAFHQDTQVSECLASIDIIPWLERSMSLSLRFPIMDSL